MYSISNILTYSYWFTNVPEMGAPALWGQAVFYALLVIGNFAIEYWILMKKPDRFLARVLRKVKTLALTMGIIGFVFLFFRYEYIPLFSRRFMYIVWILMTGAWAGFLVLEFRKIPQRRKDAEEVDRIKRYLPH
ncbi:MAG: hypothetical protein HY981_00865 [Candidatus Magasanikbacteria bacterium]|nr:hypothetical protein [Candidatus Magasanikbacteria bacterium]